MRSPPFAPARLPLLVLAVLALAPGTAPAQLMSKWGHPVITLGLTPYDAVSTGQGVYPGSNGYIPGYGYYPGPGPGHYPWLDGPHPDHPAAPADGAPAPADAVPAAVAVLRVHVAANADVSIGGYPMAQRGSMRVFVTPPLEGGHRFTYELEARWAVNGREVLRTRTVAVYPGDRLTVDLFEPPLADAEDTSLLGPPRPVSPEGAK
jgi:uncharacterized protein (TIGR03000 family)